MADIRRVPLLLIVLLAAAIGGYFVIKSQIQKDFVIAEMPNVVAEPVLEFKEVYIYNGTTGETIIYGELLYVVFPYYYNNIPYALAIIEPRPYNGTIYVRLYNLINRSLVNEVTLGGDPYQLYIYSTYYYVDKLGRQIVTIATFSGLDYYNTKYTAYKIVLDRGNITNVKPIELGVFGWYVSPIRSVIFEGANRDYIVMLITDYSAEPYKFIIKVMDEYGNVIYNTTYYWAYFNSEIFYETNNTVIYSTTIFFGSDSRNMIHYFVFDKNTKTFKDIGTIDEVSWDSNIFIAGYNEDLAIYRTNPRVGFINGKRFETTELSEIKIGWVKGNKILGITWQDDQKSYYYKLYNYSFSFDGGFNVQKIAEGLFMNLTQLSLIGNVYNVWISWFNNYVEILGLPNKYLPILFTIRIGGYPYGPPDVIQTNIALVDLDNYKVYIAKVFEGYNRYNYTEQDDLFMSNGTSYYVELSPYWVTYQPRFLILVDKHEWWYEHNRTSGEYNYNINVTSVIYMLKSYIKEEQPQPQPKPQPSGEVSAPTPSVEVTNNVTTDQTTTQIPVQAVYPTIPTWVTVLAVIVILMVILYYMARRK